MTPELNIEKCRISQGMTIDEMRLIRNIHISEKLKSDRRIKYVNLMIARKINAIENEGLAS